MVKELVEKQLKQVLKKTDLDLLGKKYEGKVRDNYIDEQKGERTIVVTDRLSAFDRVICHIPFKGQVLNKMAEFWFDQTKDIVGNHMISCLDPNVMQVKECKPLPVEMVVRAYLTGVTSTSIWTHYKKGVRDFCGNCLSDGMEKDQKLERPIITPSTKAVKGDHDESVSPKELIKRNLLTESEYTRLAEISLKLFARGQELAAKQGIILVDTKYEFGMDEEGHIVLIDEIHTPDSSRFWYADEYFERFEKGLPQKMIDKEYVRRYLADQGFKGDGVVPMVPDDVKIEASLRYIAAFEKITGQTFKPVVGDANERIKSVLLNNIGESKTEEKNKMTAGVKFKVPKKKSWGGAIVLIGTQYGDEGKGKVVDYLAEEADYVVRFQGGNNAGHTVMVGSETYKLHLLPSGTVWGKEVVIGNGVVVNPGVLLGEMDGLAEKGISVKLNISDRAHIIMPYHVLLDGEKDVQQGELTAGSTRRGIGPVYSDKIGRYGIRAADLLNENILRKKIKSAFELADETLVKIFNNKHSLNQEDIVKEYLEFGKILKPYIKETSELLNNAMDEGKNVLFEGAQGVMLCVDWGIYPHTTSSNPLVAGACVGAGIPPSKIKKAIGVVKAYTSRVGHGPLTIEIKDELGEMIREKGNEYGTTTGRPRRVGWLDAVVLRHSQKLNGFSSVAVTKLDILTGIKKLKICAAYLIGGKVSNVFPADLDDLGKAIPLYVEFDGWEEDISKIRDYSKLPLNARKYLEAIEKLMGVPISLVGIGPERSAIIVKQEV